MAKMTPSQRTHSWLRERGYTVGTTERFIHPGDFIGAGHKRDLFGVIDVLAIRAGEVCGVQTCGTDWSPHWKKIFEGSSRDGAVRWLATGQPLLLIGWRKLKAGWSPRVHWFLPDDFAFGCDIKRERTREDRDAGWY